MKQKELSWLAQVKETSAQQGTFQTQHTSLDWLQTDILSPKLAAFKQTICELASSILAPAETQFLRAVPKAVSQELFLRPCAPLFEKGEVDWVRVEETIRATIKQFYLMDLSKFGSEVIKPLLDDRYFLVAARNRDGQLSGFLMAAITPALPQGNVKVISTGVKERGLDKILMSSLLKIIPDIKRLFLFTRPTNIADLEIYRSMGFTQDRNPFQDPNHQMNTEYLIPLEYRMEHSDILQNTVKIFHDD